MPAASLGDAREASAGPLGILLFPQPPAFASSATKRPSGSGFSPSGSGFSPSASAKTSQAPRDGARGSQVRGPRAIPTSEALLRLEEALAQTPGPPCKTSERKLARLLKGCSASSPVLTVFFFLVARWRSSEAVQKTALDGWRLQSSRAERRRFVLPDAALEPKAQQPGPQQGPPAQPAGKEASASPGAAEKHHGLLQDLPDTASAGRPKREHDLWGEPEQKPVVRPKRAQIKHELDDDEVEPIPDAHYGLLGTRSWEVPQGSIEDLPAEVLRNVLAFLPVTDLFQSVSLVCRCWRDVVSDPLFIPWKKLYHRYLMKEDVALCAVEQILQDFAITKQHEGAVLGLIRYVSAIPTNRKVDPGVVLPLLRSHRLFSKAEVCIANTLPHLQSRTGPENVWAVITAMVLFSDGVRDIQKLIACLQRPSSALSVVDVTETLYCIATLLYAMREKSIAITNRIHYNVFYCLYLMENASVTMPQMIQEETQSSQCRQDFWSSRLSEVKLTHEQQRILNHKIERGQVVKIMAFAGTGKTSTLAKYAEKFADLNFLYVSFSKAVVERGKSVFPRNVTCRTFHSLAFGSVGKYYNEKDEEICEEHTPIWFINTHGEKTLVSPEEKKINVEEAKEIWRNMKDLNGDVEKKYKITCDGYLKLWQLSKPRLSGYDAVFVDEAQDCTPAIVDIVLSQTCGIILVGDPHQQIYSFRGAVNTLYTVPHTHIYYLTQSFRFGPEIAYVGATVLDVCKSVRNKTLVGGNQEGDVRGSVEGKITILSRSNFNVFEDAVRLTGRQGRIKIRVIGGLACFGLSRIYDIWKLSQPADKRKEANLVINDPFIRRWEETDGFIGLKEYATRIDDKELQVKIAIVEKYKERMPELVQKIESSHVSREALADYIIGTVHKAKGLEFDTVLVADDFVGLLNAVRDDRIPNSLIGMYPEDEWNLLYVAVTRAKKCLLMSKSLKIILALAGEHFLRAELLSKAVKDGATVTCSVPQCAQPLQSRLVVKKLPLTYSNGSTDAALQE
uniref:F-box DNA helicase 1 n=1 Tax=Anser cygnoides TaxID=8845 RepID=A0A8B9IR03_ANSCY